MVATISSSWFISPQLFWFGSRSLEIIECTKVISHCVGRMVPPNDHNGIPNGLPSVHTDISDGSKSLPDITGGYSSAIHSANSDTKTLPGKGKMAQSSSLKEFKASTKNPKSSSMLNKIGGSMFDLRSQSLKPLLHSAQDQVAPASKKLSSSSSDLHSYPENSCPGYTNRNRKLYYASGSHCSSSGSLEESVSQVKLPEPTTPPPKPKHRVRFSMFTEEYKIEQISTGKPKAGIMKKPPLPPQPPPKPKLPRPPPMMPAKDDDDDDDDDLWSSSSSCSSEEVIEGIKNQESAKENSEVVDASANILPSSVASSIDVAMKISTIQASKNTDLPKTEPVTNSCGTSSVSKSLSTSVSAVVNSGNTSLSKFEHTGKTNFNLNDLELGTFSGVSKSTKFENTIKASTFAKGTFTFKPGLSRPSSAKPGTSRPSSAKPGTSRLGLSISAKPGAYKPNISKPDSSKPGTAKPGKPASKLASSKPAPKPQSSESSARKRKLSEQLRSKIDLLNKLGATETELKRKTFASESDDEEFIPRHLRPPSLKCKYDGSYDKIYVPNDDSDDDDDNDDDDDDDADSSKLLFSESELVKDLEEWDKPDTTEPEDVSDRPWRVISEKEFEDYVKSGKLIPKPTSGEDSGIAPDSLNSSLDALLNEPQKNYALEAIKILQAEAKIELSKEDIVSYFYKDSPEVAGILKKKPDNNKASNTVHQDSSEAKANSNSSLTENGIEVPKKVRFSDRVDAASYKIIEPTSASKLLPIWRYPVEQDPVNPQSHGILSRTYNWSPTEAPYVEYPSRYPSTVKAELLSLSKLGNCDIYPLPTNWNKAEKPGKRGVKVTIDEADKKELEERAKSKEPSPNWHNSQRKKVFKVRLDNPPKSTWTNKPPEKTKYIIDSQELDDEKVWRDVDECLAREEKPSPPPPKGPMKVTLKSQPIAGM